MLCIVGKRLSEKRLRLHPTYSIVGRFQSTISAMSDDMADLNSNSFCDEHKNLKTQKRYCELGASSGEKLDPLDWQ
jgi:hypothetical protein